MEGFTESLVTFATTYGLKIIGAILVLIVGRFVAGLARKGIGRALESRKTDPAIIGFVKGIVYYLILIVTVLAALRNFGVETASLVAVLGAAAFAIGFALQGSLSNFAAGVMLLIFRPYTLGDYVEVAGVAGSVKDMGLLTTEMATPDNVKIMVPNGKVFGDIMKNYSANDTRRIDLVIGIGYGSSIEKSVKVMSDILAADERVLKDPAPQIAVSELADSSVNFVVRPWVNKADYWAVKFDLTQRIKEAFDREGIEIPFPQVTVHKAN